jgi:RES domain-containing protein
MEAAQGFTHKFEPLALCTYEVDCEDVVDLRAETARQAADVAVEELACAWFAEAAAGREPASWRLAWRLIEGGAAGLLAPSFAAAAAPQDANLVLWRWNGHLPHKVLVHDPTGRLPKTSCRGSDRPAFLRFPSAHFRERDSLSEKLWFPSAPDEPALCRSLLMSPSQSSCKAVLVTGDCKARVTVSPSPACC